MALVSFFKKAYCSERPAWVLILKLIILSCVLKSLFFVVNAPSINTGPGNFGEGLSVVYWAIIYELLAIFIINFLLLILINSGYFKSYFAAKLIAFFFAVLNALNLILNAFDVFYFRFHMQRADADLFYVLNNPFKTFTLTGAGIIVLSAIAFIFFVLLVYRWILRTELRSTHAWILTAFIFSFLLIFTVTGMGKYQPSYPLTFMRAENVPMVQNSLHNLSYSLYRRNEIQVPATGYMPEETRKNIFDYHIREASPNRRNVVLFIMESIPEDYFNKSGEYKVAMPFIDSLLKQSTYFSKAFSYSHHSNKGIVAMLAGLPTLTDLPLYHSRYVSIPVSGAGSVLDKHNYTSQFFIGDHYDDFGFAKCTNWLGFDSYYSMESVPGGKEAEKHPLGLHDEYVLKFMGDKLEKTREPFLAVNFNISTHYPNTLPANFKSSFPLINKQPGQKSLEYYSYCLEQFFSKARVQPWFNNTVFIFCSDHWMYLDQKKPEADLVQSFRIPIFIYDPLDTAGREVSSPVSQLDILNTIFYYTGINESYISYGKNLLQADSDQTRTVFARENASVYQAFDSSYVLTFDAMNGKGLTCFNYTTDFTRKNNLLEAKDPHADSMKLKMEAFLQAASVHYKSTQKVKSK